MSTLYTLYTYSVQYVLYTTNYSLITILHTIPFIGLYYTLYHIHYTTHYTI